MWVTFTPDQLAKLSEVATLMGKPAEEVVRETMSRVLEHEARVIAATKQGEADADAGNFVDAAEVWATAERILRS